MKGKLATLSMSYRLAVTSRVLAAVSGWLSSFGGAAVELRPDLDQIPALAVERDQQWARVGAADFLTPAEKRALLGLPRLPEAGVVEDGEA